MKIVSSLLLEVRVSFRHVPNTQDDIKSVHFPELRNMKYHFLWHRIRNARDMKK